jgi:hypothetical protein
VEYAKFIEELRPLQAEALNLFDDPALHEAARFRKWRHAVTTLISAIEARGYSVDSRISSRLFDIASYGPVTRAERVGRYNRDLQDTINELESIIRFFDKFGDPKVEARRVQPSLAVKREVSPGRPRTGNLKDKFESHPVIWGLTLLGVGFVAGFGARGYFISEKIVHQPSVNCRVEGGDRVAEAHHARVGALQKQLLNLEASASDRTLIGVDQEKYKDAADRVRRDIAVENSIYQVAIQQLAKQCQ